MQFSVSRNKVILICCCLYIILVTFYYHIDKYLTGVIFIALTLLIPITFSAIVLHTADSLTKLISKRQQPTLASCFTLMGCIFIFACTLFSPYHPDSENLESKVVLRACYEGPKNTATIKLRADKTFEVNWKGIYFADDWYLGDWDRKGDTICLKYKNDEFDPLGKLLLIKDGYLKQLEPATHKQPKEARPQFYMGYCKY